VQEILSAVYCTKVFTGTELKVTLKVKLSDILQPECTFLEYDTIVVKKLRDYVSKCLYLKEDIKIYGICKKLGGKVIPVHAMKVYRESRDM